MIALRTITNRVVLSLVRDTGALLIALSTGPFVLAGGAQAITDLAPGPTIHAETRVVQIDVVATDSHGKPVGDLSKQDFTVTDNGKPRAIQIFSVNIGASAAHTEAASPVPASTELPPNVFSNRNGGPPDFPVHSTVILLDQVNAYFEDAAYARQQVMDLMNKVPADERIALYVISRNEGLIILQDYTTDHELIARSLSKRIPRGVGPGPIGADQPQPPATTSKPQPQEFEYLWRMNSEQARLSLQALAEFLAQTPGRKSVFWVTQGFPARLMRNEGQFAWDKTLTALNEANVAVSTVDSRGIFRSANPATGTLAAVQQISGATGGKSYFGRNDIDAAMEEGIEASRTTYTLAFYLPDSERDNTFHPLKVQTGRPGLTLLYRQGYYAGDADLPGSSAMDGEKGELESALLNQVNADAIGITAKIDVTRGDPQDTVKIAVTVDPQTLTLKEQGSGSHGRLQDMFLEMDDAGKTVGRVADNKDFDVTRADRASFDKQGVRWPVSMKLAPGATKITIIVRDLNSGHIGSLTIPLAGVATNVIGGTR